MFLNEMEVTDIFFNYVTFHWMESYLLLEWTELDKN